MTHPHPSAARRSPLTALAALLLALTAAAPAAEPGAQLQNIHVLSTKDHSPQPARIFLPAEAKGPVPLLVVLHTWSGDWQQKGWAEAAAQECARRKWALIHPNFRGANKTPDACASELAIQDVLDAVAYMKTRIEVDASRIYLFGVSGGGHMSLMMAGRSPQTFAAVSAWVPPTDLVAWHSECKQANRGYWRDLEAVCGGPPGESLEIDEQYRKRSPLGYLLRAKGMKIDLNAGIHDGHTGSVPVSHTLKAFNILAEANIQPQQRFTDEQIQYMVERRMIPQEFEGRAADEPVRTHPVLVRREAGPVRVTIFNGGHEGDVPAAIDYLAQQAR